jgi:hypothetical protein
MKLFGKKSKTTLLVGSVYFIEYGYEVEKVKITNLYDNGTVCFKFFKHGLVEVFPAERFVSRIRSAEPKEVQELTV